MGLRLRPCVEQCVLFTAEPLLQIFPLKKLEFILKEGLMYTVLNPATHTRSKEDLKLLILLPSTNYGGILCTCLLYVVLPIKPRTSYMLGKCSTSWSTSPPCMYFSCLGEHKLDTEVIRLSPVLWKYWQTSHGDWNLIISEGIEKFKSSQVLGKFWLLRKKQRWCCQQFVLKLSQHALFFGAWKVFAAMLE